MNWQPLVFIPIFLGTVGYSLFQFSKLFRLMKACDGTARPMHQIGMRIKETLINVLGQKAVLREKKAGLMHTAIFWGFIIITVGTLEQFISTVAPGFTFEFIGDGAYAALIFLQDLFTFLVLAAVLYAFYVRLIKKPDAIVSIPYYRIRVFD